MESNCKDCLQVKNLMEKVDDLKKVVDSKGDNFEIRLTELEKNTGIERERTKMLFKMLEEIKDNIKIIADKIDKIENKDGENYSKLKMAVITSIATGIVGIAIGKLFM